MSKRTILHESVLARTEKHFPNLEALSTDDLKRAARYWFGVTASNKMRKAECVSALSELFRGGTGLETGLRALPEPQRTVLGIFKYYGGAVSGGLLMSEARARKLIAPSSETQTHYGRPNTDDAVLDLCEKFLLVPGPGQAISRYGSYFGHWRSCPDLFLHSAVRGLIEPAPPLLWKAASPAPRPTETSQRSAAEVTLDLWRVAVALAQGGSWKTARGGSPGKSTQNRLKKLFSDAGQDVLLPPAPELLYYELLRGMGPISVEDEEGRIELKEVGHLLRDPASIQAWHWVRAWLHAPLWQDGIGGVPDRDRHGEPVRIEPRALLRARELLIWALCRVARTSAGWLDLETFLADLWSETGETAISFYWSSCTWMPNFASTRDKAKLSADAARRRAYWLDREGVWAANALMGTLGYLGLVERGSAGPDPANRPSFRLTRLGQAVFAAPEGDTDELPHDSRFLIIQPNHEVLVYLDDADASTVWPLAQMARRTSAPRGRVQTFTLTRESVYEGLESGLTLEGLRQFLTEHSKTGLPDNVAHSLTEWGRKREALILRTDVFFAACPAGESESFEGLPRAGEIGEGAVLLNRTAVREYKGYPAVNHHAAPRPAWRADEDGCVSLTDEGDALALARLSQFAEFGQQGWKITAASVRKAHSRGITAEQILDWLAGYLSGELPPIMETSVRNWSSSASVFLGNVVLLQVKQPQACAMMLSSQRFRPVMLGHVPPNWFIVRPEQRKELELLLAELGFTLGAPPQLAGLSEESGPAGARSAPPDSERKSRRNRRKPG